MTSSNDLLPHLLARLVLAALCCLLAGLAHPAGAEAQRNIEVGLFDDAYVGLDNVVWLDRTASAGADSIRIPVRWKYIAPRKPDDPARPDDPDYGFAHVDSAVVAAHARGLQPVLTLTTAPRWAERPGRPAKIKQEGAWDPKPGAFGAFARAVATRYSGSFGGLPQVSFYEAWNEPNYGLTHLAPQWRNGKPYGVNLYRKLLNALARNVKAVRSANKVVAPSLGPQGRTPNRSGSARNPLAGVRPMFFLRELLCLRHNRKMTPKRCPKHKRPRFDILSHHPINPNGTPGEKAAHRDAAIGGDIGKLRRAMQKARKAGNLVPRSAKAIWVTEFWWQSNPPNRRHGVSRMKQARNLAEGLYVFWRAKVQRAFWFRIRDAARTNDAHGGASGLYTGSATPKPAVTAFRFPFVGDRRSKRKVLAWGRAPATGLLTIERRTGGGWRAVERLQVDAGRVFTEDLQLRGKAKLRASIAGERSLVWPVGRG